MSFAASRVRSLHKAESGHDMLRALGGAGVPIPFRVRALSRRVPLQVQESSITRRAAASRAICCWPRSAPVGRFRRFRRTAPSLWERERFIQRARTGGRWQLFRLTKSYRTEYFSWTSNAFTFFRAARLRCPEIPVPTFTDYAQNRTWESQFPQASEFSSTSTIILEAPTPKHYRETWPEIPQSEQRKCPPSPRVDSNQLV